MNIYNFIYCFFYNFWEKRGTDGRMMGSVHVLFTIGMHFLLLSKIVELILGRRLLSLPNYGNYGTNKSMYFLYVIPVAVLFFIFYNRKRTNNLLKTYNQIYKEQGLKNILRVLLYIVIPIIIALLLAVLYPMTKY